MDKKLRDSRDVLFTLLLSMGHAHGEEPRVVNLDELNDADKVFLLTTTCAEMIAFNIRLIGKDRADRKRGLDSIIADLTTRIMEDDDGHQRPH